MDILFHVTTEAGAQVLLPLARACRRRGHAFGAFFTHDGVRGLLDAQLQAALADAARWCARNPGTASAAMPPARSSSAARR